MNVSNPFKAKSLQEFAQTQSLTGAVSLPKCIANNNCLETSHFTMSHVNDLLFLRSAVVSCKYFALQSFLQWQLFTSILDSSCLLEHSLLFLNCLCLFQTRNRFESTRSEVECLMKKLKENPHEHKSISPNTMEGYLFVQEKRTLKSL